MNIAKLILLGVCLISISGAVIAFRANKYNLTPVFKTTTAITTLIAGITYTITAPLASPFCSSTVTPGCYVIHPSSIGIQSSYKTTIGAQSFTTVIAGKTIMLYKSCPDITGWCATIP